MTRRDVWVVLALLLLALAVCLPLGYALLS